MTNKHNILQKTICFFLVLVIFSCNQAKEATCNCELFKNGNFIHKSAGMTFLIKRQDSIQFETDPIKGYFSKLVIKWTDKCNYQRLSLESTFPFSDSIQNIRKTIPIKVQIISTGKDYYVFKAHRDNSPFLTDTIWVDKTK